MEAVEGYGRVGDAQDCEPSGGKFKRIVCLNGKHKESLNNQRTSLL